MINKAFDLTIIGAGPVGMYAAYYAALRDLKVKIIDALPHLGGQLQALYPEKFIYDIPGFPQIKAEELISNLSTQLENVKDAVEIVLGERVEYLRRNEELNLLEICTDKLCHYSKTVLITAGKGAFQPRTLGLENEEEFTNIHHFVNNMENFRDKRIVIFGGGDSAVDWANMLKTVAQEVAVVHRRHEFRAHEKSVQEMLNSTVKVLTPFTATALEGRDGKVKKVYLNNVETNETQTLLVDEVIVLYGFLSSLGPIESWDLTLEDRALLVDSKQATNIAGIYAAGDACIYPGKVKMITCGFGEATIAINSIYQYLYPYKKTVPFTSSKQ